MVCKQARQQGDDSERPHKAQHMQHLVHSTAAVVQHRRTHSMCEMALQRMILTMLPTEGS